MDTYNLTLLETAFLENTSMPDLQWDVVLEDYKQGLYIYKHPVNLALIVMYAIVFVLAVFGNIMVMLVILTNRSMRNVTNYFLFNLAVSDLLVSFVCMPLTVGQLVYRVWIYGLFLCKATLYLQGTYIFRKFLFIYEPYSSPTGVCVGASVLTIMCLSLDRYIVIHHPVKSRRISTTSHVRSVIVAIWCLVIVIMIPLSVVPTLQHNELFAGETVAFCYEDWPSQTARIIFDIFLFVFIYVVPGAVVLIAYSRTGCLLLHSAPNLQRQNSDVYKSRKIVRGRRRVAHMLLVLAVLFALSWMPYHAVSLYADFGNQRQKGSSLTALSFALLLGHSHSAQNPIVYCLMNNNFRNGMLGLLCCRGYGWGIDPTHSPVSLQCSLRAYELALNLAVLKQGGSGRMNHQKQYPPRVFKGREKQALQMKLMKESSKVPLITRNAKTQVNDSNGQAVVECNRANLCPVTKPSSSFMKYA